MSTITFGVIIGNRDFFPDALISEGRQELIAVLDRLNISAVMPGEHETRLGAVETWTDARRCADLFRAHRDRIDGVLVCLPNFGDEKGVADTLKMAALEVPVLVQAYPDDPARLNVERRRDAFCGKISVCNNLRQYGIPFSLTAEHTVHPGAGSFAEDLLVFTGVCRVARGLRSARIGAVGARPNAFNTTRYSEKLLEASGISVSTIDLSEVFAQTRKLSADEAAVQAKIAEIRAYADSSGTPPESLEEMAKLGLVLDRWMADNGLQATAIQCWTSMQRNLGVNCCTIMSMMSEKLMPSACEVDIAGVVSMYALQLASGKPSALVDWNNNYGGDPDKCVVFHCGNWAKSFVPDTKIDTAPILGSILGVGNTHGAMSGRTPAGPVTFGRITTDDRHGAIRAYAAEGRFTDDPLATFGHRAVAEVPGLQRLMRYVCKNGFEHHAAMNASHCMAAFGEALETYLGWDVHRHQ